MPTAVRGSLLRETWQAFQRDHCTLLAAGIAYYALFSFIPLATLMLALLGILVRDPAARQLAQERILTALPVQGGDGPNLVLDSLRAVSGQIGALSITGFVGLLWTASGMFGAIRTALDVAWDVAPARSFVGDRVRDTGAMVGAGVIVVVSMAGTVLVHLPLPVALPADVASASAVPMVFLLIGVLVTSLVTFVGLMLTYWHVPNVRHGLRDVWPGALLATVLFESSKHAFVGYVRFSAGYHEIYGLLGGVMLFMLWTWVSAVILLVGAEFTCQYERRRGLPDSRDAESRAHA